MAGRTDVKISVIVPVYNVEAYLPECIRSVLEQSMPDFEMILVDDGSTDGCPAICDAAAERDDRVRVIHQKNGGLSRARNTGLNAARGEWIGFVDSDDCIHPDMYEKLLAAAEKNDADMAICNILRVDAQRVPLEEQGQQVPDGVFSREEILSRFRDIPFHLAYNRVYRKHIFQNLRFPEGKLNEDLYIVTAVLDQVDRVVCLSDHLYEYRIGRPGSIMSKKKTLRNYDAVEAAYACFRYFDRRGGGTEMLRSSEEMMFDSMRRVYYDLSKEDRRSARTQKTEELYLTALNRMKAQHCLTAKIVVRWWMFRWMPELYRKIWNGK